MTDEDPSYSTGGTPDSTDPNEVGDTLAAMSRERDDLHDRLLRQAAEFDNYRKRVERERRAHADEAVVKLLLELLLVVDDFDLAMTVNTDDSNTAGAGAYRKGVELIHGKLHDLLKKQGVHAVAALGAMFDPNLHQSVIHEASPTHQEGEVIGELRRGYTLGDRLLRPSMVKVAQA